MTPLQYLTHILNGVVISSPSACMYTLDTKGQRILLSHTHIVVSKNYLYERRVSLLNLITFPIFMYIYQGFILIVYKVYTLNIRREPRGSMVKSYASKSIKNENYNSLVCVYTHLFMAELNFHLPV